jgi:hypothetical protein
MCYKFPAVRFRQALDHLKLIGDRLIYRNRSIDALVELSKCIQYEFTYSRVACDFTSCSESVICADTIRLAY